MRSFGIFSLAALLCTVMPVNAQDLKAPSKTVQFTKLFINPDISPDSQKVKVGTICLFTGNALQFGSTERNITDEKYERLFSTFMSEQGFKVMAKSSDLFAGVSDGPAADYFIGAKLRPVSIDICDSANGVKGTISLSVEWQIFDRMQQRVVQTVTTEGKAFQEKFNKQGLSYFFEQAFTSNITALIETGSLQKYLEQTPSPLAE